MGKLRRLKKLRRALRGTYSLSASLRDQMEWEDRHHAARSASAEKFFSQAAVVVGEVLESIKSEDASNFYVGMRVSGPPEAFGLPPDPRSGFCSEHRQDGWYRCTACYSPRPPMVVTAVDEATGTITVDTAWPVRETIEEAARDAHILGTGLARIP